LERYPGGQRWSAPFRQGAGKLARVGQARRMDHAQQRHLAGFDRQRRARDLVMPLQQQLPQPVEHGEG